MYREDDLLGMYIGRHIDGFDGAREGSGRDPRKW